ncbi:hypothetical protein M427DRAFT_366762 [Gonapodya prolifera JEL478]|uniref:Uncharacterized protein n=1 Tax=Gonapodya prolifera (strain JEL478) TaxID=1344416 RepID=A0A139A9L5_GONPJ|nr:hypothetical protein M427DRAFT_366762 [Gonapodya prolifera JEL478]|eukprot:KXS13437.1 hypothetical protein M427DRAFT_366762 [Gonapodya prolifera JEL478]
MVMRKYGLDWSGVRMVVVAVLSLTSVGTCRVARNKQCEHGTGETKLQCWIGECGWVPARERRMRETNKSALSNARGCNFKPNRYFRIRHVRYGI